MTVEKDGVLGFWDAEACGERYGEDQDRLRYEMEPEILTFADFPAASGARVLEIGIGMGSDFLRWVKAGAHITGVDLTERAVGIVRRRLQEEGLEADIRVADAESLPFDDAEFDLVYSWGVLHHTPDTSRAIQEARRVLKPGGRLKLMMYHRHSWVALAAWARFGLLRGEPRMTLRDAVAKIESPGTKAFTLDEARALLHGMGDVSVRPVLTHWDRTYTAGLARLFGDRFGWFLLMDAARPFADDDRRSMESGHTHLLVIGKRRPRPRRLQRAWRRALAGNGTITVGGGRANVSCGLLVKGACAVRVG